MPIKAKTKIPEFNISKALIVIEKDEDLNAMFSEKFGSNYKMAHALINSGTGIKPTAEKLAKKLFEKVIVLRKELLSQYESLELPKEAKPNNKKRWGLQAIAKDIADNFNGKPTQTHRTGKKVQELKKVFTRLELKMFKVRFTKKTLTDKQLREISGAIETFNKKIGSIVNEKK